MTDCSPKLTLLLNIYIRLNCFDLSKFGLAQPKSYFVHYLTECILQTLSNAFCYKSVFKCISAFCMKTDPGFPYFLAMRGKYIEAAKTLEVATL